MREVKIGRDKHHREQQHDRVVVDRTISALGVMTPVETIKTAPSNAAAGRFNGRIFS